MMGKLRNTLFVFIMLFFCFIASSLSYAVSIVDIVPINSPNQLVFFNNASSVVSYRVTNTYNLPIRNITVQANYNIPDNLFNVGIQNNTCAGIVLNQGGQCSFQVTLQGIIGKNGDAQLMPRVCGFSTPVCSVPIASNRIGLIVKSLRSIAITPANPTVLIGSSQQLTATGTFSDGSTMNITNLVTWGSSSINIATINSTGLVTAIRQGSSVISAANGVTGNTTITVPQPTLVSIAISPAEVDIPAGTTFQYTAVGTYSDGSTATITPSVTWNSSDLSVANFITPAMPGLITGFSPNRTTMITATFGSITSNSLVLTVSNAIFQSITVTPVDPSVAAGLQQQFTATVTFTDRSTQDITTSVSWASSNTSVAAFAAPQSTGIATTYRQGTSKITASTDDALIVSNPVTLTVTAPQLTKIIITPDSDQIQVNDTQQFTATGVYTDSSTPNITNQVTWASSNTNVATIANTSPFQGLATGVAAGTAYIGAYLGINSNLATLKVSPVTLVSIAVTPTSGSVKVGSTLQFTAIATYSDSSHTDITQAVTWSSSSLNQATINNAAPSQGLATGVSATATGAPVTIIATDPITQISSPPVSLPVTATVGGTLSGLADGSNITLSNGSTNLPLNSNGPFTFQTGYALNSSYNVSVVTQPPAPNSPCTVTNGSGTISGPNVTNVTISCPYYIGEPYNQGYIYCLGSGAGPTNCPYLPINMTGAVLAKSDLTNPMPWWNNEYLRTEAISNFNGMENTQLIVRKQKDGTYAAMACTQFDSGDKNKTWFLPARDELTVIYNNKSSLSQASLSGGHWSSTQVVSVENTTACRCDFDNGSITVTDTSTSNSVRCVRYFAS